MGADRFLARAPHPDADSTPAAIVTRIRDEVGKVVHSPRMREHLEAGGHVPVAGTPAELRDYLKAYLKDTAEQMRIAGVKPE